MEHVKEFIEAVCIACLGASASFFAALVIFFITVMVFPC